MDCDERMDSEEMFDILSDLVQGSGIWGDDEQQLLNFIAELREEI